MRALSRYSHFPKKLKLIDIDKPKPHKGYCIVEVKSVGICGRDLEHHFTKLSKDKIPFIPGHEFSGVISKISKNKKFNVGDRVVSETIFSSCNKCEMCKNNLYNLCHKRKNIGGSVDGAFSQYVKVPINSLHHIPESITFDEGALIEPSCVAYNAVFLNSNLKNKQKVLVLGSGTIGLLVIQMLKLKNVEIYLLCLKSEKRRISIAKKLGIKKFLYFENIKNYQKKFYNYFDYAYDTVGGRELSINSSINFIKPNGTIIKLGWFMNAKNILLDQIVRKSINIKGSFSHNYPIWEKCIKLIKEKKINPDMLIGKKSNLADWKKCFDELLNKKYVKVIFKPND